MNKTKLILIIIVFFLKTGNVFSTNNLFDVDNIIISNENNKNKEELLEYAFKKGFEKLIKKILLSENIDNILKTEVSVIKKFIESYQIIENTNLSNTDEIIVNISFDRKKLNRFFYEKNLSYADISRTKLIIYPVLIKDNQFYLFSDNYFYKNWNLNAKIENDFIEFILPIENLEDIDVFRRNQDNLESLNIEKILLNYDLDNYIFAIIEINKKDAKIYIKGLVSENNIIKNLKFNNLSNENKSIQDTVIAKLKKEIYEIWKRQNLIDVRTPSFLNIILDINNKTDFLKLRDILKKIDVIESYSVLELNKSYVKINIKYFGKINKLKKKLKEKNIKVSISNNQWKLRLI